MKMILKVGKICRHNFKVLTMITKDGLFYFVAQCDACSETLETDEDEFYSAVAVVKRAGWEISKDDNGDWQHKCPSCQSVEKEFEVL